MKVLQLIDSLDAGGAERMAVQIANELSNFGDSYLCTTRKEGLLKQTIHKEVNYLFLNKKSKLGINALFKLRKYIKQHKIDVVHAHATSFFTGTIVKLLLPSLKLIWHDHYGKSNQVSHRPHKVLKICSYYFNAIISVNEILKNWAQNKLSVSNIIYLQNFASIDENVTLNGELPGIKQKRIVHLANLRPQKNHLLLLKSFKIVNDEFPEWQLLLVGKEFNDSYEKLIKRWVVDNNLQDCVHFLGSRSDVPAILRASTIGVLSSESEGLPVSLLEYGLARLPVVVTDVGACREVISTHGKVVNSNDVNEFSNALTGYIKDATIMKHDGAHFYKHVSSNFGAQTYVEQLMAFYKTL